MLESSWSSSGIPCSTKLCNNYFYWCAKLVRWPTRSPVLSNLDYYLCGHLKNLIYATAVQSDVYIVHRISIVAHWVKKNLTSLKMFTIHVSDNAKDISLFVRIILYSYRNYCTGIKHIHFYFIFYFPCYWILNIWFFHIAN